MTRPRQDALTLVRGMRSGGRSCFLSSVFLLSLIVGVRGSRFHSSNKVFLYFILTATVLWLFLYFMVMAIVLWLFLVCRGWTVRRNLKPLSDLPTCLWRCIILVIVLGCFTDAVFLLTSLHNADNKVNFDVADATLAQFNMSGTKLDYNLAVKVVVGPNRKKQGVYFGAIQAWASYQGCNFTTLSLPPFFLGGKNNRARNSSTVVLQSLVFQGRQELVLPPDGVKRYRQDKAAGRFRIDVALSYVGFRGHHHLKGVDTFAFEQLPLPNATSGWLDHVESADVLDTVEGCIVALVICIICLSCCLLWVYDDKTEKDQFSVLCYSVCMMTSLIQIAILIPLLVGALKTPDQVNLTISNATLTQFNFPFITINNTTLAYNLSLAITIGPNKEKTGVYFDKMEAVAYYQGQNFPSLPLSPLYLQGQQQDGARTIILHPVLQGQQVLVLTGDGLKHYQKETASRRYNILVTLSYSGIRTDDAYNSSGTNGTSTMGAGNGNRLKGTTSFKLRVPLLVNDSSGTHVSSGSGSGGIFGFDRQHDATLSALISGFLAYGLLCLH